MSKFDPHAGRTEYAKCPLYDPLPFVLPEEPTHPMARATDPDTSHEAAAEVTASGVAHAQRAAVLEAVRRQPGGTSDELADAMGASRYTPARRLIELERAGLVARGGARPSKLTGRNGLTWWPATVPRTPIPDPERTP